MVKGCLFNFQKHYFLGNLGKALMEIRKKLGYRLI
jgi:hypothetical protein